MFDRLMFNKTLMEFQLEMSKSLSIWASVRSKTNIQTYVL